MALLDKHKIPKEVVLGKDNIPELNKLIKKAGISPNESKLIKAFRRRHKNRGYSSKNRDEYTFEYLILEEEVKTNKKEVTKKINLLEDFHETSKKLTDEIMEMKELKSLYKQFVSSDEESSISGDSVMDMEALDHLNAEADRIQKRARDLVDWSISPLCSDFESSSEDDNDDADIDVVS